MIWTKYSSKYPKTSVEFSGIMFEYRAVGERFIWELMETALSPKATSAAVDMGELKIVVLDH